MLAVPWAGNRVPSRRNGGRDSSQGRLPDALLPLKRSGQGHLLQQIHGKDPYIQVDEARKAGLGQTKYKLVEVE
jgi:hypothetical protein